MSEIFRANRQRITVERPIGRRDSVGERDTAWERVCQTWAEIRGDIVTIRYQRDLLPGYRALVGGEWFEIVGVRDRPGKTRLVELRLKQLGRGRDYPARGENEQQGQGLFSTQS